MSVVSKTPSKKPSSTMSSASVISVFFFIVFCISTSSTAFDSLQSVSKPRESGDSLELQENSSNADSPNSGRPQRNRRESLHLTSVIEPDSSWNDEHREMQVIMSQLFEEHLLANLDFETLTRPENSSQPQVSDYMYRLYEHLRVDSGQQTRFKTPFSADSPDTNGLFHETIRGYRVISENWLSPNRGYLLFNTTSQPIQENITHVELVLYLCSSRSLSDSKTSNTEDTETSAAQEQQYVNVTIKLMTKRRRRHSRTKVRVPVDSSGSCFPINITKIAHKSLKQRHRVLNISIETSSLPNDAIFQPCQLNRSNDVERPLLVIYENVRPFLENKDYTNFRRKRRGANSAEQNVTDDQESTDTGSLTMIDIRAEINSTYTLSNDTNSSDFVSASPSSFELPTVDSADNETSNESSNPRTIPANCHLRQWYVSFAEMQWHHVIINPAGYYANYCWGLCPAFLQNVNSTTHAYARSLFMLLQTLDSDIPKPFCSPIRMTPLTLLYYSKYNVTITKRFNEMVAAECACM